MHIKSITLNNLEFIGSNQAINFSEGLNLLVGLNGTGKSTILAGIKNKTLFNDPLNSDQSIRTEDMIFFDAKRYSQRMAVEQVMATLRSQQKNKDRIENDLASLNLNNQPGSYPSFAEIIQSELISAFNSANITKQSIADELEKKINKALSHFEYSVNLICESGKEAISIFVNGNKRKYPIEKVSDGESSLLSLIGALVFLTDKKNIILIDEPEVHLNWSIELRLFEFLKIFSKGKQVIVTTHSRVSFEQDFLEISSFLSTDNTGKIIVSKIANKEIKNALTKDIVSLVPTILSKDSTEITFIVEDLRQKFLVESLLEIHGKTSTVIEAGTKAALHGMATLMKDAKNIYYLRDGDNENVPDEFSGYKNFLQLKKYSTESYLVEDSIIKILSANKTSLLDICGKIKESNQKDPLLCVLSFIKDKKTKKNLILNGNLDCKKFFDNYVLKILNFKKDDEYIKSFVKAVSTKKGALQKIFGELNTIIKNI